MIKNTSTYRPSFRVTFDDGTSYVTSAMPAGTKLADVRAHFVGNTFGAPSLSGMTYRKVVSVVRTR